MKLLVINPNISEDVTALVTEARGTAPADVQPARTAPAGR